MNLKTGLGQNAEVVQDMSDRYSETRSRPKQGHAIPSQFKEYLTHPILLHQFDWTPTTPPTQNLTTDLALMWLGAAPASMKNKLQNFLFYRATWRLKVVVQGMPFAAGQLVISATPNVTNPNIGVVSHIVPTAKNQVNTKLLPHICPDPSKSETYELELPIPTPGGFYSFVSGYNQGSYALDMHIWNVLFSGTATSPLVSVSIYASMVNPEFEGLTAATTLANDFEEEKKDTPVLSTLAKGAAAIADGAMFVFPEVAPELKLFSIVADGLGNLLSKFGFKKPPQTNISAFVTNRNCDNYSQVDGASNALVLGCSQTQGLSIDPSYGLGNLNDMDINAIVQKRAWVRTTQISPTLDHGAHVIALKIAPWYMNFDATRFSTTPLGGFSLIHEWWTGDIIVDIEIVASVFHRATLLFCWDPNGGTSTPSFDTALTLLKNVTVSVSGNTSLRIRIPYQQPTPWLRIPSTTAGFTTDNGPLVTNGNIHMFVVNPVTSNGSTSPIEVNWYYSSDNIKFGVPYVNRIAGNNVEVQATGLPPAALAEELDLSILELERQDNSRIIHEEDDISEDGDEGTTEAKTLSNDFVDVAPMVEFGPRTDLSLVGFRCFGDVTGSIKDIACRQQAVAAIYRNSPAAASDGLMSEVVNAPVTRVSLGAVQPEQNFVGYLSKAFLGYRGSLAHSVGVWNTAFGTSTSIMPTPKVWAQHNVRPSTNIPYSFATVSSAVVDAFQRTLTRDYAWTQPNLDVTSRVDVTLPMINGADFLPTRNVYSTYSDTLKVLTVAQNDIRQLAVYHTVGAGDDAVFTWFLGFGRINYA